MLGRVHSHRMQHCSSCNLSNVASLRRTSSSVSGMCHSQFSTGHATVSSVWLKMAGNTFLVFLACEVPITKPEAQQEQALLRQGHIHAGHHRPALRALDGLSSHEVTLPRQLKAHRNRSAWRQSRQPARASNLNLLANAASWRSSRRSCATAWLPSTGT